MAILKHNKGFTIIELIVVIAIIAVLAGIVVTNVSKYIGKAKEARANADALSISKALLMFYTQYGDYPYLPNGDSTWTSFEPSNAEIGGSGTPYLTVNGVQHFFSEYNKLSWNTFNADYFTKNGWYQVQLWDNDGDGKLGCGGLYLQDYPLWHYYGYKNILCQDCPDQCNSQTTYFFRSLFYW